MPEMERAIMLTVIAILLFAGVQAKAQDSISGRGGPVPVDSVDLGRYVGTWYEIAKIPNSFQSKCAMNTTATYKLRDDGRIDAVNECVESDGSVNVARGIARVVDPQTNSKLKVSFVSILGINLFWGDYWIIGLDKDYKYAVVGTPSRKYGWILSRTPSLSPRSLSEIAVRNGSGNLQIFLSFAMC